MAVTTVILSDTADATLSVETETDAQGNVIGSTTKWVPKPGTPAANAETLRSKAQAALATNVTYIALASPTTAQNTAQIKALSRQSSAVIRLLLGLCDDLSGT